MSDLPTIILTTSIVLVLLTGCGTEIAYESESPGGNESAKMAEPEATLSPPAGGEEATEEPSAISQSPPPPPVNDRYPPVDVAPAPIDTSGIAGDSPGTASAEPTILPIDAVSPSQADEADLFAAELTESTSGDLTKEEPASVAESAAAPGPSVSSVAPIDRYAQVDLSADEPPPMDPLASPPVGALEAETQATPPATLDELFGELPDTATPSEPDAAANTDLPAGELPETNAVSTGDSGERTSVPPIEPEALSIDLANKPLVVWSISRDLTAMLLGTLADDIDEKLATWCESLGIDLPPPTEDESPERRALLAGRKVAEQVAAEQGPEAAAIVEIAVKSSLLVATYGDHPDYVEPVATAIQAASTRAKLPDEVCGPWCAAIVERPPATDLMAATEALHARVEAHLAATPGE